MGLGTATAPQFEHDLGARLERKTYTVYYDEFGTIAASYYLDRSYLGTEDGSDKVRGGKKLYFKDNLSPQLEPDALVGTGFRRGKLVPTQDRTASKEDMLETFSMSNVLPMTTSVKRNVWTPYEEALRAKVTENGDRLYIVAEGAGSTPKKSKEEDSNLTQNNEATDKSVRTNVYLWKVAVVLDEHNKIKDSYAIAVPNDHKVSSLSDYVTSIDAIEQYAGIDLFTNVEDQSFESKVNSPLGPLPTKNSKNIKTESALSNIKHDIKGTKVSKNTFDIYHDAVGTIAASYELKAEDIGRVKRSKTKKWFEFWKKTEDFYNDDSSPQIPVGALAGTGYDQGHLVPAKDRSSSEKLMRETFSMSNIVPMTREVNRTVWKDFESMLRKEAKNTRGKLHIVTGGYGVKEVAGIRAPTELWKAAVVLDEEGYVINSFAVIVPNERRLLDISEYITSIDEIEKLTGYDLFANFEDQSFEAEVNRPRRLAGKKLFQYLREEGYTTDINPYLPTELDSKFFKNLKGGEPLRVYAPRYRAITGREAPEVVKEADRVLATPSLGVQLNRRLGFEFYKEGRGLIGSSISYAGKLLDTLFGHYEYHEYLNRKPKYVGVRAFMSAMEREEKEPPPGPFELALGSMSLLLSSTSVALTTYSLGTIRTVMFSELEQRGLDYLMNITDESNKLVRALQVATFGSENVLMIDKAYEIWRKSQSVTHLSDAQAIALSNVQKAKAAKGSSFFKSLAEAYDEVEAGKFGGIAVSDHFHEGLNYIGLINRTRRMQRTRAEMMLRPLLEIIAPSHQRHVGDRVINLFSKPGGGDTGAFEAFLSLLGKPAELVTKNDRFIVENIGFQRVRALAASMDDIAQFIPMNFLYWIPAVREYLGITKDSNIQTIGSHYEEGFLVKMLDRYRGMANVFTDLVQKPTTTMGFLKTLYDQEENLLKMEARIRNEVMSLVYGGNKDEIAPLLQKLGTQYKQMELKLLDTSNRLYGYEVNTTSMTHGGNQFGLLMGITVVFTADYLFENFVLRRQGLTLQEQLRLFEVTRDEKGEIVNFKFTGNTPASASAIAALGLGAAMGYMIPVIEPRQYKNHSLRKVGESIASLGIDDVTRVALKEFQKLTSLRTHAKFNWGAAAIGAVVGSVAVKTGFILTANLLNFIHKKNHNESLSPLDAFSASPIIEAAYFLSQKIDAGAATHDDKVKYSLLTSLAQSLQVGQPDTEFSYTMAQQQTIHFMQLAITSRYNPSKKYTELSFGFQLLPTLGVGATPIFPFAIKQSAPDRWENPMHAITSTLLLDNFSYDEGSGFTRALMFLGSLALVKNYSKHLGGLTKIPVLAREIKALQPFLKAAWSTTKVVEQGTKFVMTLPWELTRSSIAGLRSFASNRNFQIVAKNPIAQEVIDILTSHGAKTLYRRVLPYYMSMAVALTLTEPNSLKYRDPDRNRYDNPYVRALAVGQTTLLYGSLLHYGGVFARHADIAKREINIIDEALGIAGELRGMKAYAALGSNYNAIKTTAKRMTIAASLIVGTRILANVAANYIYDKQGGEALDKLYNIFPVLEIVSGVNAKHKRRKQDWLVRSIAHTTDFLTGGFFKITENIGLYKDEPDPFITILGAHGVTFKSSGARPWTQVQGPTLDLSTSEIPIPSKGAVKSALSNKIFLASVPEGADADYILYAARASLGHSKPRKAVQIPYHEIAIARRHSRLVAHSLQVKQFLLKNIANQSAEQLAFDMELEAMKTGALPLYNGVLLPRTPNSFDAMGKMYIYIRYAGTVFSTQYSTSYEKLTSPFGLKFTKPDKQLSERLGYDGRPVTLLHSIFNYVLSQQVAPSAGLITTAMAGMSLITGLSNIGASQEVQYLVRDIEKMKSAIRMNSMDYTFRADPNNILQIHKPTGKEYRVWSDVLTEAQEELIERGVLRGVNAGQIAKRVEGAYKRMALGVGEVLDFNLMLDADNLNTSLETLRNKVRARLRGALASNVYSKGGVKVSFAQVMYGRDDVDELLNASVGEAFDIFDEKVKRLFDEGLDIKIRTLRAQKLYTEVVGEVYAHLNKGQPFDAEGFLKETVDDEAVRRIVRSIGTEDIGVNISLVSKLKGSFGSAATLLSYQYPMSMAYASLESLFYLTSPDKELAKTAAKHAVGTLGTMAAFDLLQNYISGFMPGMVGSLVTIGLSIGALIGIEKFKQSKYGKGYVEFEKRTIESLTNVLFNIARMPLVKNALEPIARIARTVIFNPLGRIIAEQQEKAIKSGNPWRIMLTSTLLPRSIFTIMNYKEGRETPFGKEPWYYGRKPKYLVEAEREARHLSYTQLNRSISPDLLPSFYLGSVEGWDRQILYDALFERPHGLVPPSPFTPRPLLSSAQIEALKIKTLMYEMGPASYWMKVEKTPPNYSPSPYTIYSTLAKHSVKLGTDSTTLLRYSIDNYRSLFDGWVINGWIGKAKPPPKSTGTLGKVVRYFADPFLDLGKGISKRAGRLFMGAASDILDDYKTQILNPLIDVAGSSARLIAEDVFRLGKPLAHLLQSTAYVAASTLLEGVSNLQKIDLSFIPEALNLRERLNLDWLQNLKIERPKPDVNFNEQIARLEKFSDVVEEYYKQNIGKVYSFVGDILNNIQRSAPIIADAFVLAQSGLQIADADLETKAGRQKYIDYSESIASTLAGSLAVSSRMGILPSIFLTLAAGYIAERSMEKHLEGGKGVSAELMHGAALGAFMYSVITNIKDRRGDFTNPRNRFSALGKRIGSRSWFPVSDAVSARTDSLRYSRAEFSEGKYGSNIQSALFDQEVTIPKEVDDKLKQIAAIESRGNYALYVESYEKNVRGYKVLTDKNKAAEVVEAELEDVRSRYQTYRRDIPEETALPPRKLGILEAVDLEELGSKTTTKVTTKPSAEPQTKVLDIPQTKSSPTPQTKLLDTSTAEPRTKSSPTLQTKPLDTPTPTVEPQTKALGTPTAEPQTKALDTSASTVDQTKISTTDSIKPTVFQDSSGVVRRVEVDDLKIGALELLSNISDFFDIHATATSKDWRLKSKVAGGVAITALSKAFLGNSPLTMLLSIGGAVFAPENEAIGNLPGLSSFVTRIQSRAMASEMGLFSQYIERELIATTEHRKILFESALKSPLKDMGIGAAVGYVAAPFLGTGSKSTALAGALLYSGLRARPGSFLRYTGLSLTLGIASNLLMNQITGYDHSEELGTTIASSLLSAGVMWGAQRLFGVKPVKKVVLHTTKSKALSRSLRDLSQKAGLLPKTSKRMGASRPSTISILLSNRIVTYTGLGFLVGLRLSELARGSDPTVVESERRMKTLGLTTTLGLSLGIAHEFRAIGGINLSLLEKLSFLSKLAPWQESLLDLSIGLGRGAITGLAVSKLLELDMRDTLISTGIGGLIGLGIHGGVQFSQSNQAKAIGKYIKDNFPEVAKKLQTVRKYKIADRLPVENFLYALGAGAITKMLVSTLVPKDHPYYNFWQTYAAPAAILSFGLFSGENAKPTIDFTGKVVNYLWSHPSRRAYTTYGLIGSLVGFGMAKDNVVGTSVGLAFGMLGGLIHNKVGTGAGLQYLGLGWLGYTLAPMEHKELGTIAGLTIGAANALGQKLVSSNRTILRDVAHYLLDAKAFPKATFRFVSPEGALTGLVAGALTHQLQATKKRTDNIQMYTDEKGNLVAVQKVDGKWTEPFIVESRGGKLFGYRIVNGKRVEVSLEGQYREPNMFVTGSVGLAATFLGDRRVSSFLSHHFNVKINAHKLLLLLLASNSLYESFSPVKNLPAQVVFNALALYGGHQIINYLSSNKLVKAYKSLGSSNILRIKRRGESILLHSLRRSALMGGLATVGISAAMGVEQNPLATSAIFMGGAALTTAVDFGLTSYISRGTEEDVKNRLRAYKDFIDPPHIKDKTLRRKLKDSSLLAGGLDLDYQKELGYLDDIAAKYSSDATVLKEINKLQEDVKFLTQAGDVDDLTISLIKGKADKLRLLLSGQNRIYRSFRRTGLRTGVVIALGAMAFDDKLPDWASGLGGFAVGTALGTFVDMQSYSLLNRLDAKGIHALLDKFKVLRPILRYSGHIALGVGAFILAQRKLGTNNAVKLGLGAALLYAGSKVAWKPFANFLKVNTRGNVRRALVRNGVFDTAMHFYNLGATTYQITSLLADKNVEDYDEATFTEYMKALYGSMGQLGGDVVVPISSPLLGMFSAIGGGILMRSLGAAIAKRYYRGRATAEHIKLSAIKHGVIFGQGMIGLQKYVRESEWVRNTTTKVGNTISRLYESLKNRILPPDKGDEAANATKEIVTKVRLKEGGRVSKFLADLGSKLKTSAPVLDDLVTGLGKLFSKLGAGVKGALATGSKWIDKFFKVLSNPLTSVLLTAITAGISFYTSYKGHQDVKRLKDRMDKGGARSVSLYELEHAFRKKNSYISGVFQILGTAGTLLVGGADFGGIAVGLSLLGEFLTSNAGRHDARMEYMKRDKAAYDRFRKLEIMSSIENKSWLQVKLAAIKHSRVGRGISRLIAFSISWIPGLSIFIRDNRKLIDAENEYIDDIRSYIHREEKLAWDRMWNGARERRAELKRKRERARLNRIRKNRRQQDNNSPQTTNTSSTSNSVTNTVAKAEANSEAQATSNSVTNTVAKAEASSGDWSLFKSIKEIVNKKKEETKVIVVKEPFDGAVVPNQTRPVGVTRRRDVAIKGKDIVVYTVPQEYNNNRAVDANLAMISSVMTAIAHG